MLALLCSTSPARAGDPYLEWWTITTPHFRVHYHGGLEPLAERTASVAETVHATLYRQLGAPSTELTDIVLTDDSDSANGLASTRPYNSIVLYVTAPEDMSTLNDYDDWQLGLVTHEYTHILHLENTSGIPALVNAIFGKIMVPNQAQPRWILEGLAVALESEHTTAGRIRSTLFDMMLRADVLEDNLASLDEISNEPRRWPGATLWYLYGGKFVDWILNVYGRDTFGAVATHHGRAVIPWGINRSMRRVTGRTIPELYGAWSQVIAERYAQQARQIRVRGLREGARLTFHGRVAAHPRFVPTACRRGSTERLLYYRDDGIGRPGLYEIASRPGDSQAELVARTNSAVSSYAPDCSLVFDTVAPSRRRYHFTDLFRLPPDTRDASGFDGRRERLTVGVRAREPNVSPDGRHVVYVTNHAGTSTLRIAELGRTGVRAERALVRSARFEQAYTPRFSPDGRRVVYSAWTNGGNRDIRVVDVATGTFEEITADRALDQQPSFSPDGTSVYFTSDRSGVANVYVYDLGKRTLRQVTNVINGAYMPQVSPDGRTLVYVGYTKDGFDLFSLELDERRFLDAVEAPSRSRHGVNPRPRHWPKQRYNPLPTLRPHSYLIEVGTGTFGTMLELTAEGSDAVGHHAFGASLLLETEAPAWLGTVDYAYRRLPFDLQASVFRGASPRDDYRLGERTSRVIEQRLGFTTGLNFSMPGTFDTQSLGLSYSVIDYDHRGPVGTRPDPWAFVPFEPDSGLLASARVGYFYSNVEGSTYGISAERGFSLGLGFDFAAPALGSEATLTAFMGSLTSYFRMPWHPHHVLALAASGGASGGTYPRRGLFSTGGFADQPAFDVYTSGVQQSAFVLRGYAPGQFVGTEYLLLNAEYRFPVLYVDRGISTLPVFLQHLSAAVFADYGGAFFDIDPKMPLDVFHGSVGAELWIQALLGYRLGGTLRLGVARGLSDQAPGTQTYFVAASAF